LDTPSYLHVTSCFTRRAVSKKIDVTFEFYLTGRRGLYVTGITQNCTHATTATADTQCKISLWSIQYLRKGNAFCPLRVHLMRFVQVTRVNSLVSAYVINSPNAVQSSLRSSWPFTRSRNSLLTSKAKVHYRIPKHNHWTISYKVSEVIYYPRVLQNRDSVCIFSFIHVHYTPHPIHPP